MRPASFSNPLGLTVQVHGPRRGVLVLAEEVERSRVQQVGLPGIHAALVVVDVPTEQRVRVVRVALVRAVVVPIAGLSPCAVGGLAAENAADCSQPETDASKIDFDGGRLSSACSAMNPSNQDRVEPLSGV
jgi:hypothetical protein